MSDTKTITVPDIFLSCCATHEGPRYDLRKPFFADRWIVATDGRIVCRILREIAPWRHLVDSAITKIPDTLSLPWDVDYGPPLPIPEPPEPKWSPCEDCEGTGKVIGYSTEGCWSCDGTKGSHEYGRVIIDAGRNIGINGCFARILRDNGADGLAVPLNVTDAKYQPLRWTIGTVVGLLMPRS